jgi:hypothetical protein
LNLAKSSEEKRPKILKLLENPFASKQNMVRSPHD